MRDTETANEHLENSDRQNVTYPVEPSDVFFNQNALPVFIHYSTSQKCEQPLLNNEYMCVWHTFVRLKKHFHIAALNPCSSSPCRNNGTCVPNEDGYRCNCPQGYSGSSCDQGELSNLTHYDPLYNDLCDCIKSVLLASLQ